MYPLIPLTPEEEIFLPPSTQTSSNARSKLVKETIFPNENNYEQLITSPRPVSPQSVSSPPVSPRPVSPRPVSPQSVSSPPVSPRPVSPFAAFSPDYDPPARIPSPPPPVPEVIYWTSFTYSEREIKFTTTPWNYSWTIELALLEQLEAVRYFGLEEQNLELRPIWKTAAHGFARRMGFQLYADNEVLPPDQIPVQLDEFIKQQIDLITHKRPLERVLLSSANQSGEVARLFPILVELTRSTDYEYAENNANCEDVVFARITEDPWGKRAPLHQLRINLSASAERENYSEDRVQNLREMLESAINKWTTDGFVDLQFTSETEQQDWLDRWALRYNKQAKIAWPKEELWKSLPPNEQQNYSSWSWPGWNRMQLLRQMLTGMNHTFYWQRWPVHSNWWATVAALYKMWPKYWDPPYILGQGTNMVVWGWPISNLIRSTVNEVSVIYQNIISSVRQARKWPGVHVLYNPGHRPIPANSAREIISVPLLNNNLYREVWIVLLGKSDSPMVGYDALSSTLDLWNYFTTTPLIESELIVPPEKETTPLPNFISRTVEGGYLTNLGNWIENILQMLGHTEGTFSMTKVGKCLDILLYDRLGNRIPFEDVYPLPFDITMWSQYQYLTNDPRWILTQTLPQPINRWGPGFIGPRAPADISAQIQFHSVPDKYKDYDYYEQNDMLPPDTIWEDYWKLNQFDVITYGDFNYWTAKSDHQLGAHMRAIEQGELLQWELGQWCNLWITQFTDILRIKYCLEENKLLSTDLSTPRVEIGIDGTLYLYAANRGQGQQLLSTVYNALKTTTWKNLHVGTDPLTSKSSMEIYFDGRKWYVAYAEFKSIDPQFAPAQSIEELFPLASNPTNAILHLESDYVNQVLQIWLVNLNFDRTEIYRDKNVNLSARELELKRKEIQSFIYNLPLVKYSWSSNKYAPVLNLKVLGKLWNKIQV